ncbi:hypothetical protein HJC23_010324 [Cyclotella cryptica]|uniref:AAA+ ATPase domain-containing protein n=1 Tax=Cyclotella cryptica TaxID=29204 RepID=A0ABD3QNZ2_9STRA|eukprot:CCRYP_003733-RA/>CCRYP_003733-RA protein AED:0.05 eAED:0.05 QI:84/0.5/0.66/1/1/1/3/455/1061
MNHQETNMSSESQDGRDNRCIPISTRIISTIPPLSKLFRKRRSSFKYDEHSTVFITAKDGQSHGLTDGSLCRLYRTQRSHLGVPVILRLVDDCNENCHVEETTDDSALRDASGLTVFLNPCLAATLGLHWFHLRYKPSSIVASLEILSNNGQSRIAEASRATLREIGVLPPTPCYRSSLDADDDTSDAKNDGSSDVPKQQQASSRYSDGEEDAGLKQFFTHQSKSNQSLSEVPSSSPEAGTARYKPRKRLLTLGSIFATSSGENHSKNVRFYQVTDIQSSNQQRNDTSNHWNAYFVSPSTHLTLEANSLDAEHKLADFQAAGFAWRLPRPSMVAYFLQSIQDAQNDASCVTSVTLCSDTNNSKKDCVLHPNVGRMVRHPSANQVADALYLNAVTANFESCSVCRQSHTTPTPLNNPSIIHVVGGEENHVSACVAEAADIMGMRYFRVDGLAAFWAHCTVLRSYPQQSLNKSTRMLTGQLPDKLNGLASAFKMALHSFPCVLHVVGIDDELSPATGHGADADSRREEEQRLLQVIYETTSESLNQRRIASSNCHLELSSATLLGNTDLPHAITPQTIVVFSTTSSLPSGPITSSLEQNSISLSSPDATYARYLWNNDADATFDSASPMLVGLSAREIEFLREKFVSLWKIEKERKLEEYSNEDKSTLTSLSDHSSLVQAITKSLLADLDARNTLTQSSRGSGGSSTIPLSSTSLPNVRWEDIGGLSTVREEIMDAVELPLKYPELFEGSRRSGILLFGPPGTGKTLVAKAVARECGLPFLSIKGPELLGSYVGESEANVRAVFEAARLAASSSVKPHSLDSGFENGCTAYGGASVLFFDELDSLAPRRGETGHGDGVMERVVATLLGELDNGTGGGGETKAAHSSTSKSCSPHVIVIGATNRPDLLDPSLLRPGRFDRLLYLGPAKTKDACLQILLAQTRKFRFEDGHDREDVLRAAMESFPPTLSGADLSAVASGALMLALKRVCEKVEEEATTINAKRGVDEKSDEGVDVNDVMESWTKEQLQPTVTVGDFVDAAKNIVPSISAQDLARFEALRNQFSVV